MGLKENLQHNFDTEAILVSAVTKENIDGLRAKLKEMIEKEYAIRYPYITKKW